MKILKYVGHSVFQNYVKTCRPFSFSELLTDKNSVLLKYSDHLVFERC